MSEDASRTWRGPRRAPGRLAVPQNEGQRGQQGLAVRFVLLQQARPAPIGRQVQVHLGILLAALE